MVLGLNSPTKAVQKAHQPTNRSPSLQDSSLFYRSIPRSLSTHPLVIFPQPAKLNPCPKSANPKP